MKGIADPKTKVVTTTIIKVVVIITPQFGSLWLNFRTSANAIVPLTSPAKNKN